MAEIHFAPINVPQTAIVDSNEKKAVESIFDLYLGAGSYEKEAPDTKAYVVVHSFVPNPLNPDEMQLFPGDLIQVENIFQDGWARGINISRNRAGITFPMSVLSPIITGSAYHSHEQIPDLKPTEFPTRSDSK